MTEDAILIHCAATRQEKDVCIIVQEKDVELEGEGMPTS